MQIPETWKYKHLALITHPEAQRLYVESRAKAISKGFDENYVGLIGLVRYPVSIDEWENYKLMWGDSWENYPEKFKRDRLATYGVGGQHVTGAANINGEGESDVLCQLYPNVQNTEQAAELAQRLHDQMHMHPAEKLRLDWLAGKEYAVEMYRIADVYGLAYAKKSSLYKVGAIKACREAHNLGVLDWVFDIVTLAWPKDKFRTASLVIIGLALFKRQAVCKHTGKHKGAINIRQLIERLQRVTPRGITAAAENSNHDTMGREKQEQIAARIARIYNKGRQSENQIVLECDDPKFEPVVRKVASRKC